MAPHEPDDDPRATATGVAWAVAAFGLWGVLPLYFRALREVPSIDIVAHRIVWSVVFLSGLITARGAWGELALARLRPRAPRFLAAAVCITSNWLLYVWAVGHGQVLQASLGYFIQPLLNALLGRVFLGERLRPAQLAALAIAAVGVAVQGALVGEVPWISLAIAASFGVYSLLRKGLTFDGTAALLVETSLVAPLALAWLALGAAPASRFGMTPSVNLLLVGTGAVTALPLIWFAAAARRLRLSTLGVLQYLSPTGQFLCGVLVFGEPWTRAQATTFALIWTGVALYAADALRGARR